MRFSDHARVQGKTGYLGSLPRTLIIHKRLQGLQCENLSILMWTHCDTVSHRITVQLLHHILCLPLIHQVTVFDIAF